MIGRLRGVLLEKSPPYLLLDLHGVGYDLLAPMSTFYRLSDLGSEVILHTHFAVSEISQQLYGFISKEDRSLFRLLIKVNGVGPKMALAIMSSMSVAEFVACVQDNNVTALVRVPGVGKKTAERLIIEMRDKLKDWVGDFSESSASINTNKSINKVSPCSAIYADAESALITLGYKPTEAAKAVAKVLDNHQVETSEELIRLTLRSMMPN